MTQFSPDRVKARIAEILRESSPAVDVHVRVDAVPYGLWIWDEDELVHRHFSPASVSRALGVRRVELPEMLLSWAELS